MKIKKGAGVIPFAIRHDRVSFLFHKTFAGRRAGLLVDFGGGSRAGESHAQTAAREFVEETEAMFLSTDFGTSLDSAFEAQYHLMLRLIETSQRLHPNRVCSRIQKRCGKPRDWKTFFVEVEHRDLSGMNTAWAEDASGRFKKRRELFWVPAERLLDIVDNQPEMLWRRIREYEGLRHVVLAISQSGTG